MFRPSRYLTRLVFAGVVALVATLVYQSTRTANASDERIERRYSFSLAPEVEILRLWGTGNWTTVYSLSGDGRLTFGGENDLSPEEYYLSYAECDELIRIAVEGGIMEHDGRNVFPRR